MSYNASLLSLLTISTDSVENIFFAYLKQLNEIAPSSLYWYPNKGSKGEASFIWRDKQVKQWLLIGEDAEMFEIWNSLLASHNGQGYWLPFEDANRFKISPNRLLEKAGEYTIIPSILSCNGSASRDIYEMEDYNKEILFLVDEQTNCNYIEGYKYHPSVNSMTPPGLLSENELFDSLKKKVNAVFERREIFYYLHETISDKRKTPGSKKVGGFIQADPGFRTTHYVEIRNVSGDKMIGKTNISPDTGLWEVPLETEEGEGQFLMREQGTDICTCGEKYYILKEIKFQTNIVHTVINDLYGRKINLSESETMTIHQPIESLNWDATLFPDTRQGEIELSDKIKSVLISLGKKIIISDPYLLGDFEEKDGILKVNSAGQMVFMNALLTAFGEGRIESLKLIGNWGRAGNYIAGTREDVVKKYELLWKLIKSIYKSSQSLKLKNIELILSNEKFHDRYWLSEDIGNANVYFISNSTTGLFESRELSIIRQNDQQSFKQRTKAERRYESGEKFNLIK